MKEQNELEHLRARVNRLERKDQGGPEDMPCDDKPRAMQPDDMCERQSATGAFGPEDPDYDEPKRGYDLSSDPADFDGKLPQCEYCTDNVATKQCNVGGVLLCEECYAEWLMGRFDEPEPGEQI